jgi:hypothetical protein
MRMRRGCERLDRRRLSAWAGWGLGVVGLFASAGCGSIVPLDPTAPPAGDGGLPRIFVTTSSETDAAVATPSAAHDGGASSTAQMPDAGQPKPSRPDAGQPTSGHPDAAPPPTKPMPDAGGAAPPAKACLVADGKGNGGGCNGGGVCNPATGTCVDCLTDDDCKSGKSSHCDTATFTCLPCASGNCAGDNCDCN